MRLTEQDTAQHIANRVQCNIAMHPIIRDIGRKQKQKHACAHNQSQTDTCTHTKNRRREKKTTTATEHRRLSNSLYHTLNHQMTRMTRIFKFHECNTTQYTIPLKSSRFQIDYIQK